MTNKIRLPHFLKSLLAIALLLPLTDVLADDRVEYIGRLGWYNEGGSTQVEAGGFSSDRYVWGSSDFYNTPQRGYASWIADITTVTSHRTGLFTAPEFISANGDVDSSTDGVLPSGHAYGHSQRYEGNATNGKAAWVADAATGITTRIGLFEGPEYTGPTSFQNSEIKAVTQSGYVAGESMRYVDSFAIGSAAWVANAATGVTSRVGIYSGGSTILETCTVVGLSESGYVAGNSAFQGAERFAWVADAATGTTTRIGLFGGEFSGTLANSYEESVVVGISDTGYVIGNSTRFTPLEPNEGAGPQFEANGKGAWVANATTGETIRVGFFEGSEFTFHTGAQQSEVISVSNGGYVAGTSSRYSQTGNLGEAAWVADARTGVTSRVGLYDGPEFTSSAGDQLSRFMVGAKGDTDYIWGISVRYTESDDNGIATWVANLQTGVTTRVGLFSGAESGDDSSYQSSNISKATLSGYATGSTTFEMEPGNGSSLWIANAQTGITTRIGLHEGPEFTSASGAQVSTDQFLTESGYASGYSSRFSGETDMGRAAWAVDIRTGVTTKIGLYDARHTDGNGYQHSETTFLSESGLVAGFSVQFHESWGPEVQTAWVFDLLSNTLVPFDFRRDPTDISISSIVGITADGFVYGFYTNFTDIGELNGQSAFIWSKDTGTMILSEAFSGDLMQYGWEIFLTAEGMNSDHVVIGSGIQTDDQGYGIYAVQVVPEPATALLVLLGVGGMLAGSRRQRKSEVEMGIVE